MGFDVYRVFVSRGFTSFVLLVSIYRSGFGFCGFLFV